MKCPSLKMCLGEKKWLKQTCDSNQLEMNASEYFAAFTEITCIALATGSSLPPVGHTLVFVFVHVFVFVPEFVFVFVHVFAAA